VASLLTLRSTTGERRYGRPTGEAHAALIKPAPSDPDEWLEYRLATERIWATPDSWDPDWVRAKGRALLDHGIDAAGTGRQFRAILGSGSRDAALSRLTTPTLVLHGSADTLIHPDGGRHTADVIPGARYLELEGMGHDLPPSRWTEMADAVFEFLADLAP
jgi:pimeloyl-ACP methyl ester carboxylesterase